MDTVGRSSDLLQRRPSWGSQNTDVFAGKDTSDATNGLANKKNEADLAELAADLSTALGTGGTGTPGETLNNAIKSVVAASLAGATGTCTSGGMTLNFPNA